MKIKFTLTLLAFYALTYTVKAQLYPVISITSASSGTYGGTIFLTTNTGGSTGAVTYTVTNGTGGATVSGSTLTLSGAGTVTVTASVAADANYNAGIATQIVTISKANPIISTSPSADYYGAIDNISTNNGGSTGAVSYSVVNGTGIAVLGINWGAPALWLNQAGTVTLTTNVVADANYNAATISQVFTIYKQNPSVLFTSASSGTIGGTINLVAYGSGTGTDTGSATYSVVNGTGSATLSGSALSLTSPGTVTVTANVAADVNNNAGTATQIVTINKATPIVSITSASSGTYGGTINLTTNTGSSTGAVTYTVTNGTGTATVSGSTLTLSGAGTVTVTASVAADADYNAGIATQTITINKATPTVSITSASFGTYGGTINLTTNTGGSTGAVTYTVTNGTGTATISGSTLSLITPGTVTITSNVAADANYSAASSVPQTVTINKANPIVTITSASSGTYGGIISLTISTGGSTGAITYSVVSGSSYVSISGSTLHLNSAGTAAITATVAADANYNTATSAQQTIIINKANPVVTITSASSGTYGGTISLTATTSGSTGSVTYSVASGSSYASVSGSTLYLNGAGAATIMATAAADANYNAASSAQQTITINQASLTVTADNQSKTYGTVNPTLSISYSGFLGTDNAAVIDSSPAASTTATQFSNVGTYTVSPSGGSDNNYSFTFVNGTLTINKANLTATADNQSKTYGAINPTLSISYSGFLGTDNAAVIDTPPTASTTATQSSNVGTYTISQLGGTDNNYFFTFVNGTLTINKANLTITADNQSKTYGTVNPALTISYAGFVNGENSSFLNSQPTISTSAGSCSSAGSYPITLSGGAATNYNITLVNGTLTINSAPPVTVTPSAPTISVGSNVGLTASGASSYSWTPSTGLSSTSGATVTANPTLTTTYTVSGTNANGCGMGSANVTVTVTCTAPSAQISAPNGLNICAQGGVELDAPSGAGYVYLWSNGQTTQSIYISIKATFTVRVSNVCGTGGSVTSSPVTTFRTPNNCALSRMAASDPIISSPPTEDMDLPTVDEMTAYPNPATDVVTVAMPWNAKEDTQVQLFDMFGKLLTNATLKKNQWKTDLSVINCAEGLYIVRVGNGDLINAVKVMVVRK